MCRQIVHFFILVLFISCNRDDKVIEISNFSEPQTIFLEPYKNYPYTLMNIWVKGYVNDTILIWIDSKKSKPILKLSGQINERWQTDYYGEGKKTIFFEPYKASEGNIEIKAKL